jgi:hypothetical protein
MTELRRLVIEPRAEEVVIRVLYRSKGDSNPGTKARAREVSNLVRTGLEQALEALENAECVGTSGFTTREDVLLATISPDTAKLMKGA